MISISQQLSRRIKAIDFTSVPEAVSDRGAHLILDTLGCAIAAQALGQGEAVYHTSVELSGLGRHVVVGYDRGLNARDAAFVNGVLMHSIEFDDVHMPSVLHPSCVILPTVLAAAKLSNANGREALTAYVCGIEAGVRLGMVGAGLFQRAGFHPTSVIGVFAAALAAGKLLGLSELQLTYAQGIALSLASGSMQFLEDGGATKRLHAGWAAQAGLSAAVMAAKGMSAPIHAYEGKYGLYALYLQEPPAMDSIISSIGTIGKEWHTASVSIKPFPAAYYAHACIESAIELAHYDNLRVENIESVVARVPPPVLAKLAEPLSLKQRPTDRTSAQFALPYLVASSLVNRQLTLTELTTAAIGDKRVLEMAARVRCEPMGDSDFPAVYPGEIEIRLAQGETLTKKISINLGADARPIANDFIVRKFIANAPVKQPSIIANHILAFKDMRNMESFDQLLKG